MAFRVYVLASAKDDFREVKAYIKHKHGETAWLELNRQFKATLADIGQHPLAGHLPEEARALGLTDIRQRLVGQTRVIYQLDGTEVYVHMFVSTLRDFMAQLTDRLL